MPIELKQLESGIAVVTISGRLVLGKDEERLETITADLIKQGQKKFVYDLSTLDYADSSGIGTLVSCLTNIKKGGGELRMAGASPRMMRLFTMTGVQTLIPLYPTLAAAVE
ncbi:MAG TPA: STAS domain-containing protein [Bryobacteraceae bacterium]|jgi:anti-anti-sigma factor|nr:STAS domain-containing protein [Bryobacteraceae bacterium]